MGFLLIRARVNELFIDSEKTDLFKMLEPVAIGRCSPVVLTCQIKALGIPH
jgi:hypothetical protein